MTKKIILCIITFLYGLNNTSFSIGDVRIRLFHLFGALLVISLLDEYFSMKKEGNQVRVRNILTGFLRKENGYSIFVMSIWFIYALISFFWIRSIPDWQLAISFFVIGIFCTIAFSLFLGTRKDVQQAFQILGIVAIIHNIIGWYEIKTQNHLLADSYLWGSHPVSFFHNTNNFAVFLFFAVFILYALGESSKNTYLSNFYKIASLSSIILIYFTESRGVLLGLAIGLTIFTALSSIDKFKNPVKNNLIQPAILMILLAIVIIAFSDVLANFFTTGLDVADADRTTLIKNGLAFFRESNGFGVGAGNIEYWMGEYQQFIVIQDLQNVHNWWVEILVAYGLVIFLLYMKFYYKLLKNNLYKFVKSKNLIDGSFSKAMVCIMGGFPIVAAVPSTLIFHNFHWVFWAVAIAFQGVPLVAESRNIPESV